VHLFPPPAVTTEPLTQSPETKITALMISETSPVFLLFMMLLSELKGESDPIAYRQRRRHSSRSNFARSSHCRFSYRRKPRHSSLRSWYLRLQRSLHLSFPAAAEAGIKTADALRQSRIAKAILVNGLTRFILVSPHVMACRRATNQLRH
jgi:hypothetical protein